MYVVYMSLSVGLSVNVPIFTLVYISVMEIHKPSVLTDNLVSNFLVQELVSQGTLSF